MRGLLRYISSAVCCLVLAVSLSSCAESAMIAAGIAGAGGLSGIALWLTKQPWMAKICYWVGDEAALTAMPVASATVDADVIALCAEGVAYCQSAQGIPAATVNATLAASLKNLPPAQVAQIQAAALILDEFLPPSTSTIVLTSEQLNDIIGFLQGWEDGTRTCLNNISAVAQEAALAKAQAKKSELRAKHPQLARAAQPGGWFCK